MTISAKSIHQRLMREEEPEWIVWALVIVMLLVGGLLRNAVVGRTQSFSAGGVSLAYPDAWVTQTEENQVLQVADPFSSAQFPTGVTVQQVDVTTVGRNLSLLSDIALAWSTRQARNLQAYRSLAVEETTVAGQEAIVVDYAYIPQATTSAGAGSIPVVARAQDFLIQQDETLTIITLAAEAGTFEGESKTWGAILDTLEVK